MRSIFGLVAVWICLGGVAAAQLQGRIIVSGSERAGVVVRIETLNGQIVNQAFTSSRGTFAIQGASVSANNPMYLVVEEEGYKPIRQLIRQVDLRGGLAALTLYLEPLDEPLTPGAGSDGPLTVDVRQLQVEIPQEAVEAYEDAQEDSADGDHEQAAERLERAVELAPEYYDAWIDLGRQYEQLARHEDAGEAYLRASEINPADTRALINLGALHYQEGERLRTEGDEAALESFLSAHDWLRQAVDLDPASAPARFYLGAAFYRLGAYPDAEQMLQNALSLEENYADAQLMLINVYARQNRYDAALDQARAFLEAHPDAPQRDSIERVREQLEELLGL